MDAAGAAERYGTETMENLRNNPHIYEINLMTWLASLSFREKRKIAVRDIPRSEWKRLKDLGMDIVWLMGIWRRSPYSVMRARSISQLVKACRSILNDFKPEDITGSPYSIFDYEPDPTFGSKEDFENLKHILEDEGLSLIVDFVPNHTACDHPWIRRHPDWFIPGQLTESGDCPAGFFPADTDLGKKCIAHGKDPYFDPWNDTAQINYFNPEARQAMLALLSNLPEYGHGCRCDMAMLVLKDVFSRTWEPYKPAEDHSSEFWPNAIERLKSAGSPFLFLGEVYWGKESQFLDLGFDYVYDKSLYDLMTRQDINGLKNHLSLPVSRQRHMIRFLENHDEPRALSVLNPDKVRCAMIIQATLPGMRFWQHGQLEGRRVKTPVQLRREPFEPVDHELERFSTALLNEVNQPVFHEGDWEMRPTRGWPDNNSHHNLMAWRWELGEERRLIVVNFTDAAAQGYVELPAHCLREEGALVLTDPLKNDRYLRLSSELAADGLFVDLPGGGWHFFKIERE